MPPTIGRSADDDELPTYSLEGGSSSVPRLPVSASTHEAAEPGPPPPTWTSSDLPSQEFGQHQDATAESYHSSLAFCRVFPPFPPMPGPDGLQSGVSSAMRLGIAREGLGAWTLVAPAVPNGPSLGGFHGSIERRHGLVEVVTSHEQTDACIFSNIPILLGNSTQPQGYGANGKGIMGEKQGQTAVGVFYEVTIYSLSVRKDDSTTSGFSKMKKFMNKAKRPERRGTVSIGASVLPYPPFRHPGWNRLSVGLHSDDGNRFFEDSLGGKPYAPELREGDVVGFLIRHGKTGDVEYFLNGKSLGVAFPGLWFPRTDFDVYACLGVDGPVHVGLNFGAHDFQFPPPLGTSLLQYS